jgi:hypothetical protein
VTSRVRCVALDLLLPAAEGEAHVGDLKHLLLRGDQDSVSVEEQRWFREILEEPDSRASVAPQHAQFAGGQGACEDTHGDHPERGVGGARR